MALDQESFSAVGTALGYQSLACYLVSGNSATVVLSTKERKTSRKSATKQPNNSGRRKSTTTAKTGQNGSKGWPEVVGLNFNHYITELIPSGSVLPIGWVDSRYFGPAKTSWPKGSQIYFPEQELQHAKIFFVGISPKKRSFTKMALDGSMDAVSRRVSQWIDSGTLRHFVNEDAFHEHLRQLNLDLQLLLDHEMRNPLTVVHGYANMLIEGGISHREAMPMYDALCDATLRALKAIDKLSLTMSTEFDRNSHMTETLPVDIGSLATRVYTDIIAELKIPEGLDVKVVSSTDRIYVRGIKHLLHRAIYEVMSNAVLHSWAKHIVIKPGATEGHAFLDIIDDGKGIPPASHHLVFQRFYQDPFSQKEKIGTRGLGLGLYLSRHIIEEHGGQLLLVPHDATHGTTFRFIWPLAIADSEDSSLTFKRTA